MSVRRVGDFPSTWRGAALSRGSSVVWQQAAPENDPACSNFPAATFRKLHSGADHRTTTPSTVPGSRLLPTYRTAA